MRVIKMIDLAEAERVIDVIIRTAATDGGKPVVVAVTDDRGDLVSFKRMDGAPLRSISIAINKAYTAARTGQHTVELAEMLLRASRDVRVYTDDRFTLFPGGVVLKAADAAVIGAVGVSGRLPDDDHKLSLLGSAALFNT